MKKYLTPKELSEYLGIKVTTLSNWRSTGEGPLYKKLGQNKQSPIRYRIEDVEAWVEARNSEAFRLPPRTPPTTSTGQG